MIKNIRRLEKSLVIAIECIVNALYFVKRIDGYLISVTNIVIVTQPLTRLVIITKYLEKTMVSENRSKSIQHK